MLNFRNTSIALIVFAVLVAILLFFNIRLGMFPLLALIIWLILLVIGSINICSGFYLKAFCKARTGEKIISLTFDDGPDPEVTPEVIKILRKYNISATFFIIGHKAVNHKELLKKMIEEGHVIGVHSYQHAFFFDLYGKKKMERDLVKASESVRVEWWNGGKVEPGKLFRPPYGVTNPTVAKVVKKLGYRVIGWSIRSLDTTIKDPMKVAERVNNRLHPGAVILMHDTRKDLPGILENVIENAVEKGYRFVGLEVMLKFK